MPSLALTLIAGLLAIAVNRAFHNAGWAWAKLATGIKVWGGGAGSGRRLARGQRHRRHRCGAGAFVCGGGRYARARVTRESMAVVYDLLGRRGWRFALTP
jgi:hypothetical protein